MTTKLLFILPSLHPNGAATQVRQLASALPRDRFEVCVCALWRGGAEAVPLRRQGVKVDEFGGTWRGDPLAWRQLWRLIRAFQPDVIHAWRLPCPEVAALTIRSGDSRVLLSGVCLPPPRSLACRLSRWLLNGVDCFVGTSSVEAERYQRLGLPANRIVQVPPGTELISDHHNAAACRFALDLPAHARLIVCVGPLERHKGFREAIWAFQILQFLYDGLHLVLIGEGPEQDRLRQFVRDTQATECIHFAGWRVDVPLLLSEAEVVWVPSLTSGGIHVALEAMAAARPVVASRLPELAQVVVDGETGYLIPAGDKIALARQTRRLLDDRQRSRMIGEAGRQRAARQFTAARMVDRLTRLYEGGSLADEQPRRLAV
jgi:glycosyltransferase involved in cell wall biosynthesis